MSYKNLLVCPSLKLMFELSSSITDDRIEDLRNKLNKFDFDTDIYVGDWTPKNIASKRIGEIKTVLDAFNLIDFYVEDKMFCIKMMQYDKNARIISELNEEDVILLEKEGYVRVVTI